MLKKLATPSPKKGKIMYLVAISDKLIPKAYMEHGLEPLKKFGVKIDCVDWEVGDIKKLQEINLKVEKNGSEVIEPTSAVFKKCKDAEIIITHFCTITKKLIDSCTNLKIICVLRGGVENINVEYATQKKILCVNTPGRTANAVADYTIGMILSETRNIARSHSNLKFGKWVRDYVNEGKVPGMAGRTFGIVGLGEIGKKVAKRLKGFDVNLLGYDPYETPEKAAAYGIKMISLDELLKESDFISIHARLTDDTFHMIGKRELELMKPTSYLINTARSGLIDEKELYEVLKDKKILGAALDVFDIEPTPEDYPIISLDNVTVTPHLAGGTVDTVTESPRLLANNISAIFSGKLPRGNLNLEKINFDLSKHSMQAK